MYRYLHRAGPARTAACTFAVTAAVCVGAAGAARADNGAACPNGVEAPYSVDLGALTGPEGADLTVGVHVDPASACPLPPTVKKIQLKTFAADGTVASTLNLTDVALAAGGKTFYLGRVPRDRRVEADLLVRTETPERTFVVRGATRTLLRPDLVVEKIVAPAQALVGDEFNASVVIAERNGDVGATGDVSISALPGSVHVDVGPGGSVTVPFAGLTFDSAIPVELTFKVEGAAPGETDADNNTLTATVDVTGHQLSTTVLFPSLGGYGAQFNNHLYAPITPPPAGGYGDVEAKVEALEPQLVRIFYNDNWDGNWNGLFPSPQWELNYASFVKVVQLAQESGAIIDISFQNLGNARTVPLPAMAKFADVLEDLVRVHGLTNVRWAEVGNEPNGTDGGVTLEEYNALYRALHAQLVARGLHDQVQLMGGGLVERSNTGSRSHYEWLKYIGSNMSDVVDAYAEHVYWWYDKPGRLEYRLRDIYNLATKVLPPEQQKPMYLMEYGIRGYNDCGGKPTFQNRYYLADCSEIWETNVAAFHQLWFNIATAQLGFAGSSKWDAYQAIYDRSSEKVQVHWLIGPASEGYPVWPAYHALSLLFHTTAPGWQTVRVEPWGDDDWGVPKYDVGGGNAGNDQPEPELAAYGGPYGELTIIGLDTHGQKLNTASAEPPLPYSIGGLPANTTFNLALWNATGDGTNSIAGRVTTNAAGVARFAVPLQAAFALTTEAVS